MGSQSDTPEAAAAGKSDAENRAIRVCGYIWKTALMFLIMMWNPLGLVGAAERFSRDAFLKLASPFYPTWAQDRIAVVLITDDDLPISPGDSKREVWPIGFDDHECLLRKVLSAAPRSVFIDFVFGHTHGEDHEGEHYREFLSGYAKGESPPEGFCKIAVGRTGIPIVLGDMPKVMDLKGGTDISIPHMREKGLSPDFADTGVPTAAIRWAGFQDLYPFSVPLAGANRMPTAAARLAEIELQSGSGSWLSRAIEDGAAMRVMWGTTPPETLSGKGGCRFDPDGRWDRLWMAFRIFWHGFFSVGASHHLWKAPQSCLFHEFITARQVMAADEEELRARLSCRHVLIGSSLSAAPDFAETPTTAAIPGVFLHAMALDNLLSLKSKYLRDPPGILANSVELFFLLLATIFGQRIHIKWEAIQIDSTLKIRSVLCVSIKYIALYVSLLTAVLMFIYFCLYYTPVNWVAFIFALSIIAFPRSTTVCRGIQRLIGK